MREVLPTNGGEEQRDELSLDQRLMEEITILRIEGTLFCFDPKEAKRRTGTLSRLLKHADGKERPVSIEIHPTYGQPSVIAFRIVQAIFAKITEGGYPYANIVSFSQRELARLVGRDTWGGSTSRQLYHAMMQLQRTGITCSIQDKEKKEYHEFNFYLLNETLFSKKEQSIRSCTVKISDPIVHSLNKRHIAFFNLQKLNTLEIIGAVLYKRVFFHLSNIYRPNKTRSTLVYEKDYADICAEWLGGLKPEKYASKIGQQLGRHLNAIKATGLIRKYEVAARADRKGFKIVFHAGEDFFEDYVLYYVKQPQSQLRSQEIISVRHIQKPLELVAYFHECMEHQGNTFLEKETAQASELLETYSEADIREFIGYAVARARETHFKMQHFGAVLTYLEQWKGQRSVTQARERRTKAIKACPHCDGSGYIHVKDRSGAFCAVECPHDPVKITEYEERTGLRVV